MELYRHSHPRFHGVGKDLVIALRLLCCFAVREYVNCLFSQAVSEIIRLGKSKPFKVFSAITVVGEALFICFVQH